MSGARLDRRRFLRGAGFAVGLPLLESFRPRAAAAQARKRLLIYYQPDGDMDRTPYWFPSGGETDFKPGEASAVLEPIRSKIVLFRGVHHGVPTGDAHGAWMKNLATGGGKQSLD